MVKGMQSVTPDPSLAAFDLTLEGGVAHFVVRGDWTVAGLGPLDRALKAACAQLGACEAVAIEASGLGRLDTSGAYLIDRTARALSAAEPELAGARGDVAALLQQARAVALIEQHPPVERPREHGLAALLERTGRGTAHLLEEGVETLAFLGATVVSAYGAVLRPTRMRWTALVSVIEESGLDAVPIVAFLSFFVGMVMAFIGATSLEEFGASIFVVESMGIGLLRELSGVLVAIIIAGRTNSAFTAQIGAMKMRQEIDAMQTLGLDPLRVIVAPRILAMVIMLPVLTFIGMLAGLAGGMTVCWMALEISPTVFLNRLQDFVPIENFWIGMVKAPVFGLAMALIGCRQGLEVGGSVQSLGERTTRSVVQAIFSIIVIDALFAIFFMEIGI